MSCHKEGRFRITKELIHPKDIKTLNVHAPKSKSFEVPKAKPIERKV